MRAILRRQNATRYAARLDSLDFARDRLVAAQRLLFQDRKQTAPLPITSVS